MEAASRFCCNWGWMCVAFVAWSFTKTSFEKAADNWVTAAGSEKRNSLYVICQGSLFSSKQRSSMPPESTGTMYCCVFIGKMAFIHSLNARVVIKCHLNKCNRHNVLSHFQACGAFKKNKSPSAHRPIFLPDFLFPQEPFASLEKVILNSYNPAGGRLQAHTHARAQKTVCAFFSFP